MITNDKNIIFILSLPRSGSTLLQKLLMSHSQIKSIAEPWILLPLIYLSKKSHQKSEFDYTSTLFAISDLISNLPNQRAYFYERIRYVTDFLYYKLFGDNCRYFIDKTSEYYHIIAEFENIYSSVNYIFLFNIQLYNTPTACAGSFIRKR